jgi:hypothetical protein
MKFSALVAAIAAFGNISSCHGESAEISAPGSGHRILSFQNIWDYTAWTKITDIASISYRCWLLFVDGWIDG